jgi:hypothetical protein
LKGFTKGDRVLHAKYGAGTLGDINEYHTLIDFDEHGTRRFMTNLVVFEATQIPAPERPVKARRKAAASGRPR